MHRPTALAHLIDRPSGADGPRRNPASPTPARPCVAHAGVPSPAAPRAVNEAPEAVRIVRDPCTDDVHVEVTVGAFDPDDASELSAWLTTWWLRWIGQIDCAFAREDDAWLARCRLMPHQIPYLTPTLQDLLVIRHAVCIYEMQP